MLFVMPSDLPCYKKFSEISSSLLNQLRNRTGELELNTVTWSKDSCFIQSVVHKKTYLTKWTRNIFWNMITKHISWEFKVIFRRYYKWARTIKVRLPCLSEHRLEWIQKENLTWRSLEKIKSRFLVKTVKKQKETAKQICYAAPRFAIERLFNCAPTRTDTRQIRERFFLC